MFIRLSRYIILGLIISLVTFLVVENNNEKLSKKSMLWIGGLCTIIIFAISFRVEFYTNTPSSPTKKQGPLVPQKKPKKIKPIQSKATRKGVSLKHKQEPVLASQKEQLKRKALEMIENIQSPVNKLYVFGVSKETNEEELMAKIENKLKEEVSTLPKTQMAEKIAKRVMNPRQKELDTQNKQKENKLSMQYESAAQDTIKEKIRKQLYNNNKIVERKKESDYVIMPVSEWSLPLERRKYNCIPKKESEPCDCAQGENTGFWGGSFMKIKGAPELLPRTKIIKN